MRQGRPTAASSGWGWSAQGGPSAAPPPRVLARSERSSAGAVVAAVLFVALVAGGAAAFVLVSSDDEDEPVAAVEGAETPADGGASEPAASEPATADAGETAAGTRSFDAVSWTTDTATTLEDLARTWAIPTDTLTALNPELSGSIPASTEVVVYSPDAGASISIGPPNDGKLIRGVPLPEGDAWLLPEDRSRAFATAETIAAVTAALDAYAAQFPGAAPIQMGELSKRRGGEISGHQSHQTGRDVDIRLIVDDTGEGFDADRNWFLIKTLIDGGDVRNIFLNRREQEWLREAADADVGAAAAAEYFVLINHERGHTIHMHVRFGCAPQDKRCVGFSQPDAGEHDTKKLKKLPRTIGKKRPGSAIKLPNRRR